MAYLGTLYEQIQTFLYVSGHEPVVASLVRVYDDESGSTLYRSTEMEAAGEGRRMYQYQ